MNKQQAALLSVISNSLLILLKVIAGIFMNSISVISEAIHSGIDLVASLIAFFSIKAAGKPEDDDHPFGHGKYENVSGLIEALLIFLAAGLIIFEAVKKILHGTEIMSVDMGIVVMFISTAANFIISRILYKVSKKTNSIALEADALHLMTDVYTSLGVMVGLIVIRLTGIRMLDPIFAFGVAILIIFASLDITKRSIKDLVDGSLSEEEIEQVIKIVNAHPEVNGHHKLRTRNCGNRKEIDMHILVSGTMPIEEAHSVCDSIEQDIKEAFPSCYVVLHIEPVA